jgi:hypothetical protein
MAIQTINLGNYANDGTGDDLRVAFTKVNANFAELNASAAIANGVNVGAGVGVFFAKDTTNLQFKSLTSTNSSVTISSTGNTVNLAAVTNLQSDLTPTLGANLNLNNKYVYGGDIQSTVYGYNIPISTMFNSLLVESNNLNVDMGAFLTPTGYETDGLAGKKGYLLDWGLFSDTPVNDKLNFGSFSDHLTGGIGQLTIAGNLTTTGAYNLTLATTANTSLTLPTSGTLTTTANNLSAFAATTSAQLRGVISDETGTGSLVFATSPTLITPTIGVATATSITFPDTTVQTTAFPGTYAQSGATSAYATKRILQYNPSTNVVTYSNYIDAASIYVTGYSSEIHVSPVALDNTGKGTIGDPVKTIAQAKVLLAAAFETTGAGQRKTIILHPGSYAEDVTIDTQYTVLTTHELVGKSTTLAGTLTLTTGCTVDGLKMTNLVISGASAGGSVDIIGCTVTTATTKTSTAYTVFRGCDLSSSSLSITGGGTVILSGGNYFTLTVNNAAAGVLAKAVISMGPVTLTAGTLQLSDTLIYSATNTSYAITQSAGSAITINNCQTLIPDLSNVSRNSLNGFYSILSSVYDKPNSILVALSGTGGPLNSIIYDQYINADRLLTSNTSFDLINTTATTVNAFGAATAINVGSTGALVTNSGYYIHSVNATVAAAGNAVQASATPLTKDVNILTTVTSGSATGVALPAGTAGMVIFVYNSTATAANIYPVSGGSASINALANNVAFSLAATTGARFVCASATKWYTI